MARRVNTFLVVAAALVFLVSNAFAAGPYGTIRVGNWGGGAYTNDADGKFSHCAASTTYRSGVTLLVGQNAVGWLLGFAHPDWRLAQGENLSLDVTFDGQAQFHFFGAAVNQSMVIMSLPAGTALEQFRKSHLMAVVGKGQVFQFDLASTGQLLPTIANCFSKMKAGGLAAAGDFAVPVTKPTVAATLPKAEQPKAAPPTDRVDHHQQAFKIG